MWPADSFPPSKSCKRDRGHPSRAHWARSTLQPLPLAKEHLHRKAQLTALAGGALKQWPLFRSLEVASVWFPPFRSPSPSGVLLCLGARWGQPRTQTQGETGKLGARGPAQPSPFGVSSLAASYYLCELRLVGEDDRDAVPSGRPSA